MVSVDPAALTVAAVLISFGSFVISLIVARRDRARLVLRAERGITVSKLGGALVVRVANAGRRPLQVDPTLQLLLAGGDRLVVTDLACYREVPADHILKESQAYVVVVPYAVWRRGRADAKRAHDARPPRCVAVGVVDSCGTLHRAQLPQAVARWFNG